MSCRRIHGAGGGRGHGLFCLHEYPWRRSLSCTARKDLAESLGWDASSLDLFDIYLQRNETPLSTQLIEELGNKSLLEFIIKQSQHTNKKIDPGLKSKFDLESNESHKKYLINQKEDNIDFESFLEGFRGEIK